MRKTLHIQPLTRLTTDQALTALKTAASAVQLDTSDDRLAEAAETLAVAQRVTSTDLLAFIDARVGGDAHERIEDQAWRAFQYALPPQFDVWVEVNGQRVARAEARPPAGREAATRLDVRRGAVCLYGRPAKDEEAPLRLVDFMQYAPERVLVAFSEPEGYLRSGHVAAYGPGCWPEVVLRRAPIEPYTLDR